MKKDVWQHLKSAFGVHKMDEMEMHLNLQAMRWTYLLLVVVLWIWGIHDFIVSPHTFSFAMFLVILQNVVYFTISTILKSRTGDRKAFHSLLIWVILTAAGVLSVGVLFTFFH